MAMAKPVASNRGQHLGARAIPAGGVAAGYCAAVAPLGVQPGNGRADSTCQACEPPVCSLDTRRCSSLSSICRRLLVMPDG